MEFRWQFDDQGIDWEDMAELFRIAPLSVKDPEEIRTIYANSMFKCFVFEKKKLIGTGRVLADGINTAYLCDIALHPKYQGLGLGKEIVSRLLELCEGHKKVILYAVPGKEGFYRKLGFLPMATAMAKFRNQEEAITKGIILDDLEKEH